MAIEDTKKIWGKYTGINAKIFRAHAIQYPSKSAAYSKCPLVSETANAAGWSNFSAFEKLQDKPIQVDNFAFRILNET